MSTLRWILLILGIVLIAGLYFAGRRKQEQSRVRQEPELERLPPQIDSDTEAAGSQHADLSHTEMADFESLIAEGLQSEVEDYRAVNSNVKFDKQPSPTEKQSSTDSESVQADTAVPSMLFDDELVLLHLLAPEGQHFDGQELYQVLSGAGFVKQPDKTFSCKGKEGSYLAVNAIKPGIFPDDPQQFETKAIALILRLSQVNAPLAAFDELLLCARYLQDRLQARLCDGQRSSLTVQTIHYLQEEIQAYQHKHRQ